MAWDMGFDGLPCLFSWPSKGELNIAAYTHDTNSALQSRNHLSDFLKLLESVEGAESISIITHSMGVVSLIEALRQLPAPEAEAKPRFQEIIMAAPDIDRDNCLSLSGQIVKFAAGATLYASANDLALKASKALAAKIPRAGDVPPGGPIVVSRIDSIDASAVSNYVFGLNHSYFAADRSIVEDFARIIMKHERPPNIRNPTLRRSQNNGQIYWKFPD
jgi:esterase/lipase superfamily enzyme